MEASPAGRRRYLDLSRLSRGEVVGMLSALVLVGSLFVPWFSTSEANEFSTIDGRRGSFDAFQAFDSLPWWLIAGATAPFVLAWIIARGHRLTWNPGEVTMIVGAVAIVLVLLNGVVLGRPGDGVEIALEAGWFIALAGAAGIAAGGYVRQARYTRRRRPPGTL